MRAVAPSLLIALLIGTQAWAGRLPPEFQIGVRVAAKGELDSVGELRVRELELDPGEGSELRGLIEALDPERRTLQLLGFTVQLEGETKLRREPDEPMSFSDLQVGQRIRAAGTIDNAGILVARSIRVRTETYPERRFVGTIDAISDAPEGDVVITLLGRRARITARTELVIAEGVVRRLPPRARALTEDDDLLMLGQIRPHENLAISGELRPRGEQLTNADLDPATADHETVPEFLGLIGALAQWSKWALYAEASARTQYYLDGGPALGSENEKNLLNLSQLYARYGHESGDLGWRVQLGRQRATDERQWYIYTKNLDSVSALVSYKRWSFDVLYGRAVFNQNHFREDQTRDNLLLRTSWALTHNLELSLWHLARSDRTARGDSPTFFGLRLLGGIGRHVDLWADAAWQRGDRPLADDTTGVSYQVPIRADAFDLGLTLRTRTALDPSLTLGYAVASGGDDEAAGIDQRLAEAETFRQSGFERNRGSFNGVVSFRYYGEVLDPELANLQIATAGVGLRPIRTFSIDLVYHDYRQDRLSTRRVHGSPIDVKPNGLSDALGDEWNLIVGYEPTRRFELRFTAGRFSPGEAFPAESSAATLVALQTKLRF
jgi:hypothetical protein